MRASGNPTSWLIALLLVALAGSPLWAAATPPELIFAAPPELEGALRRARGFDRQALVETLELLGLEQPGPPIHIKLVAADSPEARQAPSWVLGYAFGAAGWAVVIPARVPGYPGRNLESVLHHEITHVLVARAAHRRSVPRWFDEGLAMTAARRWTWGDRSRLVFATFSRGGLRLADLDRGFPANPAASARAYAFSAALVRHLIETYGQGAPARILEGLGRGRGFASAFRQATGHGLGDAENLFWRQLDWRNKWVPFLTSSAFVWLLITSLALLAFRRRRALDQAQREIWDAEDRAPWEQADSTTEPWVN